MAEKFHNDADKMVYKPRSLEPEDVEEASDKETDETPKKTPAKSAPAKKES